MFLLPDLSMLWCAAPLLLLPWLATPEGLGPAASRLVVAGFALGAFEVAAGTLDLAELGSWAAREGNAGFMAPTLGVLLVGAVLPLEMPRRPVAWLVAIPLLLAIGLLAIGTRAPLLIVVGGVIGALPLVLTGLARCVRPARPVEGLGVPSPCTLGAAMRLPYLVVLVTAVLGGPIVIAAGGLATLLLLSGWRARGGDGRRRWPLAAMLGATGLVAFTWLALTVAGQPLVPLHQYVVEAPLSPAGERMLTTFLMLAVLGAFAPWPLHRLGDARATLPIAVAFTHAAAVMVVPDGVRDWLPLATMVLVPAAVLGVLFRSWDGAAGALAALAALRPGPWALAGALAVVLWPAVLALRPAGRGNPHPGERVTFPGVRLGVTAAAAGAALVVMVTLRDEVLLGTLLAAGLAIVTRLAARPVTPTVADPRPAT